MREEDFSQICVSGILQKIRGSRNFVKNLRTHIARSRQSNFGGTPCPDRPKEEMLTLLIGALNGD
jgi:hypothetical protein